MTTETLTLTDFLLARIAEDEAAARSANGPRWESGDGDVSEGGLYALQGKVSDDGWSIAWFELGTANEAEGGGRVLPRWPTMPRHAHKNAVHAARHDPARVLAECEAKRRIVERCSAVPPLMPSDHLARGVLALIALPYADHPDFREEWTS